MVLHSRHRLQLAEAHAAALRRAGARPADSSGGGSTAAETIVIRSNRPGDDRALARLAGLDSAAVPAEPLLVAEASGEIRAALSLRDRRTIADPFHRTQSLVDLLVERAEQVLREAPQRRRWGLRLGMRRAQRSGTPAR